ncbi:hypothetical protein KR018_005680 [Drosophila ironensis]|nr:hypothetical protein KR018_005680 [Drosophila ironensis]
MELLQLNDDCLDIIFNHFKLNKLILMYNEINSRFDGAIERQLPRFRNLEFTMRSPPIYCGNFFICLGRQLSSLHINVGYSIKDTDILRYLQPLCQGAAESRRLQAFKLSHIKWSSLIMTAVEQVLPFLRFLDLRNSDLQDFQIAQLLKTADNLEILALLHINNMTGDFYLHPQILGKAPSLKFVHITMMGALPFPMEDVSKSCPHLSLFFFDRITNESKYFGTPEDLEDYFNSYDSWFLPSV